MDVRDSTCIIRPELAAPEVDDYDEIAIKSIEGKTEIGSFVEYIL